MADGYVESSRSSELIDALIDLHVLCLNGEGFMLRLSPSTLGRDVRKMVSERLPAKKGAKLAIYHSHYTVDTCKIITGAGHFRED